MQSPVAFPPCNGTVLPHWNLLALLGQPPGRPPAPGGPKGARGARSGRLPMAFPVRRRHPRTMDPAAARRRLVATVAEQGIADARVLEAIGLVPRERFVEAADRGRAHEDRPLAIGRGQTISQPYVVARMVEAMDVGPGDRVLDVGTGSGYAAAVLAHLAGEVWSIERHPALARRAATLLEALGLDVHVVVGDGTAGLPQVAPFAAIGVTAAPEQVPDALVGQLEEGGRLVIPVGPLDGPQRLLRLVRRGAEVVVDDLGGVRFVPLVPD